MEMSMANPKTVLIQFSEALSALATEAQGLLADVQTDDGHRLTGVLWRPNAVVVSEQVLPETLEYRVTIAGRTVKGRSAGRDAGTNVAVLRLEEEFMAGLPQFAVPNAGALAVILGVGTNGITTQLTSVRSVGGPWQSLAGGTIDHRIALNGHFGAGEEGGPVLAADGAIFGISTRGAGRQSLVIPASTVDRILGVLLEKGSVERGWLGVSLSPVALPESLRPESAQRVGLMVMDVGANSPANDAGIVVGDILLSAGGSPATRFGKIARQFGADSIGKSVEITLARAGSVVTTKATIAPRKSE
jgi:S1-C subfamily serine protease